MSISNFGNPRSRCDDRTVLIEIALEARAKYLRKYPTEAHSMEAICARIIEAGYVQCPCGSSQVERKFGERECACALCGHKISITAGTFFARMRAAQPWHFCIWMMEGGVPCNAHIFHFVAAIAYSTAWNIFRKISMIIENQMAKSKKARAVDSFYFMAIFSKRSRITPVDATPMSEQDEAEKEEMARLSSASLSAGTAGSVGGNTPILSLTANEQAVYAQLSNRPTSFNTLLSATQIDFSPLSLALLNLELNGHITRIPSGQYVLGTPAGATCPGGALVQKLISPRLAAAIGVFIEMIGTINRGVSRKFLQAYLAYYWAIVDKRTWGRRNAIVDVCAASKPIARVDIVGYRSALVVKTIQI